MQIRTTVIISCNACCPWNPRARAVIVVEKLKDQLLCSQDEGRSCLLEAAAMAGWLSRGPQLPLSLLELLNTAWDDFERRLDGSNVVAGGFWRRKGPGVCARI